MSFGVRLKRDLPFVKWELLESGTPSRKPFCLIDQT